MADPIYLVQGDTGPQIKATLTRDDTGAAEDLTGATVNLHFRKKYTESLIFTLSGTITDATAGDVVFNFSGSQLDIDAGEYEGEIEVTSNSSVIETVYEVIDFVLRKDFA